MSDFVEPCEPIEEGVSPLLQGRLVNQLGVALTPSDVEPSGVSLKVYADDSADECLAQASLDPNSTLSLAIPLMQTPLQPWRKDNIGRNFAHIPDLAQATPPGDNGGYTLFFEYTLQLVAGQGGGVCYARFRCPVVPVRSA